MPCRSGTGSSMPFCRRRSRRPSPPCPSPAPAILDTLGKRETNNSTRIFFSAAARARFPACEAVAAALQSDSVVHRLEEVCGTALGGAFLRIEYCQDTDGFWLEPHTDIGAKLFTMLVYLSSEPGSESWGTDLMTTRRERWSPPCPTAAIAASSSCPAAIPGTASASGRSTACGARSSSIMSKPEWRARHELSYPVGRWPETMDRTASDRFADQRHAALHQLSDGAAFSAPAWTGESRGLARRPRSRGIAFALSACAVLQRAVLVLRLPHQGAGP